VITELKGGIDKMNAQLSELTLGNVCTNYLRTLDLDNAVATVNYTIGDTVYFREHFVSYPDNFFATRYFLFF
jgi:hypothetical protein